MDFSKTFQINGDYKDRRATTNWDMFQFAEIVFVDKTHPANKPLLYQLSNRKLSLDEILNTCKTYSLSFSREAFLLVGEVVSLDKKRKQILLSNKNTIAYTHLVIASGKKPVLSFQDEELVAALQALTDALRVKPKIPSSFHTEQKTQSSFFSPKKTGTTFALTNGDKGNIGRVVHPYIIAGAQKFNSFDLDTLNSRFYEVHT